MPRRAPRDRFGARCGVELGEDGRQVVFDRARRPREALARLRRSCQPSATSPSTSTSRAVRPAALSRVDARGPRGDAHARHAHPLTHAFRHRGRAEAVEDAPARRAAPLRRRRRARAPVRTGSRALPRRPRPRASVRRSAARRAARTRGRACERAGFATASTRARRRTRDGACASASSNAASPRGARAARSPSSHAASARAQRTGATRCSVPDCGTPAPSASSSTTAAPGSPRRVRSAPSATSAMTRLVEPADLACQHGVGALAGKLPSARRTCRPAPATLSM